jgi:quercetin dioxygenase-like cupin family protein
MSETLIPKSIPAAPPYNEVAKPLEQRRSFGRSVRLLDRDFGVVLDDPDELQQAYKDKPRTHVSTDTSELGGWQDAVAQQFNEHLHDIGKVVVFTLYDSMAGDATFGSHVDAQPNLTLHVGGAKEWEVDGHTFLLREGDAILVPAWMQHEVNTPQGRSTHLAIAAIDNYPIKFVDAA